jgi:hypothetical protein
MAAQQSQIAARPKCQRLLSQGGSAVRGADGRLPFQDGNGARSSRHDSPFRDSAPPNRRRTEILGKLRDRDEHRTLRGDVFARYELEIDFTGTAVTNVNAHPSTIDGGDNDVASLSTQDKLQEAVRRALPLLPSGMAREVGAIFTPTALAIMAAMAALWAASLLAVVGEIADVALPITGGILMGRAAIDVGGDLAAFMTGATGATTHQ